MFLYTERPVGCTLTWSLYSVLTRYLSFVISLCNSIRGFKFSTPDMKIGGDFGSVLRVSSSSIFSSAIVLNLLVVAFIPPSQ